MSAKFKYNPLVKRGFDIVLESGEETVLFLSIGLTIIKDTVMYILSGTKNYIENNEILNIPADFEYNIYLLKNDGIIINNGTINIF